MSRLLNLSYFFGSLASFRYCLKPARICNPCRENFNLKFCHRCTDIFYVFFLSLSQVLSKAGADLQSVPGKTQSGVLPRIHEYFFSSIFSKFFSNFSQSWRGFAIRAETKLTAGADLQSVPGKTRSVLPQMHKYFLCALLHFLFYFHKAGADLQSVPEKTQMVLPRITNIFFMLSCIFYFIYQSWRGFAIHAETKLSASADLQSVPGRLYLKFCHEFTNISFVLSCIF